MRIPILSSLLAGSAFALTACASSSLEDVCTSDAVTSALPSSADLPRGVKLYTDSVNATVVTNYTVAADNAYPGASGLSFCNVTFNYYHPELNDTIQLLYWLPAPSDYTNRYLTVGGFGFAISQGTEGLPAGLVYGAATGTTDGGFGWGAELNEIFLRADGVPNLEYLESFAYKSIHELTVIGKAFTKNFYESATGSEKLYAYYQGCSEGGREGFSQVQRYSDQFDGVVIGAPAIRLPVEDIIQGFPSVVETTVGYAPPPCEMEKIINDTISACDGLDGRYDGVVSRTDLCKLHHNATKSVGSSYYCAASSGGGGMRRRQMSSSSTPEQSGNVTEAAAKIANEVWQGMHDSEGRLVYYSLQPSADFSDGETTYNTTTGKWEASLNSFVVEWVNLFLKEQNASTLSIDGVTYDTMRKWMVEGIRKYPQLQTTWPDLEGFSASGAKIIHYHGDADPGMVPASSLLYQDQVRKTMYPSLSYNESYARINEWWRLYLVPGAGHCAPSTSMPNGPFPRTVLGSAIDWVENGVVPEKLNATVLSGEREGEEHKLCTWPLRPLWHNNGTDMECVFDQQSIDAWLPELTSIPIDI